MMRRKNPLRQGRRTWRSTVSGGQSCGGLCPNKSFLLTQARISGPATVSPFLRSRKILAFASARLTATSGNRVTMIQIPNWAFMMLFLSPRSVCFRISHMQLCSELQFCYSAGHNAEGTAQHNYRQKPWVPAQTWWWTGRGATCCTWRPNQGFFKLAQIPSNSLLAGTPIFYLGYERRLFTHRSSGLIRTSLVPSTPSCHFLWLLLVLLSKLLYKNPGKSCRSHTMMVSVDTQEKAGQI